MFKINVEALPLSEALPYLVRMITYNNRNWAAVYHNLQKYRRRWGMVEGVLERTGATVRSRGEIYKDVVQ